MLVAGLALVVLWWLASLVAPTLPDPAATFAELGSMIADGRAWSLLWRTTVFMTVCFAVAVALGPKGCSRKGDAFSSALAE